MRPIRMPLIPGIVIRGACLASDRYIPRERILSLGADRRGRARRVNADRFLAALPNYEMDKGGGEVSEIYGIERRKEGGAPFETIIETVPVPLIGTTQIRDTRRAPLSRELSSPCATFSPR